MLQPYLGWSPSPTSIRKKLLTLILLPVCLWWLSRTVCFQLHPTNVFYNPLQNFQIKTMLVKSSYRPPTFKENRNKIHQMLLTPTYSSLALYLIHLYVRWLQTLSHFNEVIHCEKKIWTSQYNWLSAKCKNNIRDDFVTHLDGDWVIHDELLLKQNILFKVLT